MDVHNEMMSTHKEMMPANEMGEMGDMPGMKMYFHTGYNDYILLKEYLPTATWHMVLTCLLVFLITIGYEGLKVFLQRYLECCCKNQTEELQTYFAKRFRTEHVIQSVLHILQVAAGYLLMLLAMSFNVWIFLSIVLGAGFGYFLFAVNVRRNAVVIQEHCN